MIIGHPTLLPKQCLMIIKETYSDAITHNIEIGHKWCELIIKNKVCLTKNQQIFLTLIQSQMRSEQGFLESYIREHQSMGVYLHGEMILSREMFIFYLDHYFLALTRAQDILIFIGLFVWLKIV